MIYLEYFLYLRVAVVWDGRNLPSVCRYRRLIPGPCLFDPLSILAPLPPS